MLDPIPFRKEKMSVPPIAKATLQAALINAGSNVLAQGIKSYRADVSLFVILCLSCFYLSSWNVRKFARGFNVLKNARFCTPYPEPLFNHKLKSRTKLT
jgi:hypothetical protein